MEADLVTQFTEALKELISEEDKAKILSVLSKKKEPGLGQSPVSTAHVTKKEVREEIESYLDGLMDEVRVVRSATEQFATPSLGHIFSNTMLFLMALFLMKICSL